MASNDWTRHFLDAGAHGDLPGRIAGRVDVGLAGDSHEFFWNAGSAGGRGEFGGVAGSVWGVGFDLGRDGDAGVGAV